MPRKILRLPIVLDRTGLSRSTVYQRVTEGNSQGRCRLGPGLSAGLKPRSRSGLLPDRGQPGTLRPESWSKPFIGKMTSARDSGVAVIWDWIAGHELILSRPS